MIDPSAVDNDEEIDATVSESRKDVTHSDLAVKPSEKISGKFRNGGFSFRKAIKGIRSGTSPSPLKNKSEENEIRCDTG